MTHFHPQIWKGLETDKPIGFDLSLTEVGNWYKEIEKFAPHLKTIILLGCDRIQEE